MDDGTAWKMSATTDERDALPKLESVVLPVRDRPVLAQSPFFVGGVKINRALEGAHPFRQRGVEMRVRDRDGVQTAESLDHIDGSAIKGGDASPQQVAAFSPQLKGAL